MFLSKFSETLTDLMFERGNISTKKLAEELGLPAPTLTRYKKGQHCPTVKNLVLIADYFNCSTDFLLGREEENPCLTFNLCPPFSERLIFLSEYYGKSFYKFYHAVNIPESTFFEWKNGSSQPTLESIIKIAEFLDRRIDFVLGRES